jgi:hypothetical protein
MVLYFKSSSFETFPHLTLGRINNRGNHFLLVLKKAHMLKCKIYFYRRSGTLTLIIFTFKKSQWPLRANKNCLQIGVYCIQNDRLEDTVSMKQTINLSEFVGLRYPTKLSMFCLISQPHELGLIYCLLALLLADRFEYNEHQFEDNFVGPKGPREFLHVKRF